MYLSGPSYKPLSYIINEYKYTKQEKSSCRKFPIIIKLLIKEQ